MKNHGKTTCCFKFHTVFRTFYKRCHETTLGLFWKLGSLLSSRLKLKHSWLVKKCCYGLFHRVPKLRVFSCQNGKWLLPWFPRRVSKFCFLTYHLCKHTCILILYPHPALNLFTVFFRSTIEHICGIHNSCMLSPCLALTYPRVVSPKSVKSKGHWLKFPCGSASIAGTDPSFRGTPGREQIEKGI